MTARRICLVSPSHLASNPRLVKEADALHASGYAVHVVCGRYFPPLDGADAAILARASWSHTVVDYSGGPVHCLRKLRWKLAQGGRDQAPSLRRALHHHHPAIAPLASAATRTSADLCIGHTLAGLAAAGLAARRTGSKLGFDAEDFHDAETKAAETDHAVAAVIRRIESEFLPRCSHLTAASPLIARAYAQYYAVREPVTVLNTFPLSEAPATPAAPERPDGLPLLYWFSQTIGPDRGLEALMAVLGRMRTHCALRLRGLPAPGFPDALRALARDAGFAGTIEFAPLADPDRMVHLAATADLGLSLEQSTPLNRDLCLTNKIFTYLLAGVPVVLTPTSAQRALAPDLGAAALLADLTQPEQLARQLDVFFADPARMRNARQTAWRLALKRYCWEVEQEKFLASIRLALS